MGWATEYIAKLQQGETVEFRPTGRSMEPRIMSGQLCIVSPVDTAILSIGDIVLCKVKGKEYLHIVKAIYDNRFRIGNNRGRINGWTNSKYIYGRLMNETWEIPGRNAL